MSTPDPLARLRRFVPLLALIILLQAGFETLIRDPFVRGMHVHQHQPMLVLRQYINTVQLRQREAQGWKLFLILRGYKTCRAR